MSYSEYTDHVIAYAKSRGIREVIVCKELTAWGRIYYSKQRIELLSMPSARDMLVTIIHEVGHWLSYTVRPQETRKPRFFVLNKYRPLREQLAWKYGWETIVALKLPFTAEQWQKIENDDNSEM